MPSVSPYPPCTVSAPPVTVPETEYRADVMLPKAYSPTRVCVPAMTVEMDSSSARPCESAPMTSNVAPVMDELASMIPNVTLRATSGWFAIDTATHAPAVGWTAVKNWSVSAASGATPVTPMMGTFRRYAPAPL